MPNIPIRQATEVDAPRQDFSTCPAGFVTLLEPPLGLRERATPAARAPPCSADVLKMFRHRLLAHHDDEERDLFPSWCG